MIKVYIGLSLLFFANFLLGEDDSRWFNTKDSRINLPIGGLSDYEQDLFVVGRSFFTVPWVFAPSATTARDGLGPLFNANACISCHHENGLGEKFNKNGEISRAIVTKLSKKDGKRVPHYGHQIAVNGNMSVPFEAMPTITNTPINVIYPDGRKVTLQKPTYGLKNLNYGPLPDDIIIVQRRAPALIGLGLLTRVSDDYILREEDADDANGDGISGRANWLDKEKTKLGRFTAKASVRTVIQQSSLAAAHDMGLTNPFSTKEACEPEQLACKAALRGRPDHTGNTLDLTPVRLAAITLFENSTRVPIKKMDDNGLQGKKLFTDINCSSCHLPKMETADGIKFAPYTDMLIHDMGDGLADGRTEALANGNEFRTAPLWGLSTYAKTLKSKKPYYLHDARAETLEEAILWHGGEAEKSKQLFMNLSESERNKLLTFLNQL